MTDNPCREQGGRGFSGGKRASQNKDFTKPVVSTGHGCIGIRCSFEQCCPQNFSIGQRDSQDGFKQLCLVFALGMKRVQEIIL